MELAETIGVEFADKEVIVRNKVIKLQCWDTSGDTRFRSTVKQYFRAKAGCILAFDITWRESFNSVPRWCEELRELAHPEAVILLVGTKSDLAGTGRKVSFDEAQALAQTFGIQYREVSSKTGQGVQEVFSTLAELILDKIEDGKIDIMDPSIGVRKNGEIIASDFLIKSENALAKKEESFLNKIFGGIGGIFTCPKKDKK